MVTILNNAPKLTIYSKLLTLNFLSHQLITNYIFKTIKMVSFF